MKSRNIKEIKSPSDTVIQGMRDLVTTCKGLLWQVMAHPWGECEACCLEPSKAGHCCPVATGCQWGHFGAWISGDPSILDISTPCSHQMLSLWLNAHLRQVHIAVYHFTSQFHEKSFCQASGVLVPDSKKKIWGPGKESGWKIILWE